MPLIKGYSTYVQMITRKAIRNADSQGAGRLSFVKRALIERAYEGIANNEKLLDSLVFRVGQTMEEAK